MTGIVFVISKFLYNVSVVVFFFFFFLSWLAKLAAVGGNFIRVWMAVWGFAIEWQDT